MDTYKKPIHEVCIDKTDCKNEANRSKPTADTTKDSFRKTPDPSSLTSESKEKASAQQ